MYLFIALGVETGETPVFCEPSSLPVLPEPLHSSAARFCPSYVPVSVSISIGRSKLNSK